MAFNGKYRRGYMRVLREQKREEAEARNAAYQAAKTAEATPEEQEPQH